MRKFPKKFTGTSKLVGPLNLIIEAAKDRTPLAGDGIKIDETPHGCRISALGRPVAAGGSSIEELVIVSDQPEFLVCKPFSYASDGSPASVSLGAEILVAKQHQFRPSSYHGKTAYPGVFYEGSASTFEYYLESLGTQSRAVYAQRRDTGSASRSLQRVEDVWPPFTTYVPGADVFTYGTIIPVANIGSTIMTVIYNGNSQTITRIDASTRSWKSRSGTGGGALFQCTTDATGAAANGSVIQGRRVTAISPATGVATLDTAEKYIFGPHVLGEVPPITIGSYRYGGTTGGREFTGLPAGNWVEPLQRVPQIHTGQQFLAVNVGPLMVIGADVVEYAAVPLAGWFMRNPSTIPICDPAGEEFTLPGIFGEPY